MPYSYLIILIIVISITLLIDLLYTQVMTKYFIKLLTTIVISFAIIFLVDYTAIQMGLWRVKGSGITGIEIFNLPAEEYGFMLITPYSAIVLWEIFHKTKKNKGRR